MSKRSASVGKQTAKHQTPAAKPSTVAHPRADPAEMLRIKGRQAKQEQNAAFRDKCVQVVMVAIVLLFALGLSWLFLEYGRAELIGATLAPVAMIVGFVLGRRFPKKIAG